MCVCTRARAPFEADGLASAKGLDSANALVEEAERRDTIYHSDDMFTVLFVLLATKSPFLLSLFVCFV